MTSNCIGSFEYSQTFRQRSGVDFTDNGHNKILVKEGCRKVLNALPELLDTVSVESEVYAKNIENTGNILIVYEFSDHQWTVIEAPVFQPGKLRPVLKPYIADRLSAYLSTSAVFYNHQPYETRHDVYDGGSLTERFSLFPAGELERQKKNISITPEDLHYFSEIDCYAYFFPPLGKDNLNQIKSNPAYRTPYNISDCLIEKFHLYVPDIRWQPFLPDKSICLSIENMNVSDFKGFGVAYLASSLI